MNNNPRTKAAASESAASAEADPVTEQVRSGTQPHQNLAYSAWPEPEVHVPGYGTQRYDDEYYPPEYSGDGAHQRSAPNASRCISAAPKLEAVHVFGAASPPRTGVRVGPFLGGVGVSSIVAALLAWLLTLVATAVIDRVVPDSYWEGAVPAPTISTALWVWSAIASNIAAALVLFVLTKLGIAPVGRWFGLLGALLTAVAIVTVINTGSGIWQHYIPPAIAAGLVGASIISGLYALGSATTLRPNDF